MIYKTLLTYLFLLLPPLFCQVALPRVFTFEDSLVIRNLLDLNDLQKLKVDSVVRIDEEGRLLALNLNRLSIDTIPASIGQIEFVYLHLQNNYLNSLPIELSNILPLRIVILDSNNFTSIPGSYNGGAEIYSFSIGNNKLSSLTPEDVHKFEKITVLDLSNNKLETITPKINELETLAHLNLSNNKLTDLPTTIMQLDIRFLDISNNFLCNLPDSIESWVTQTTRSEDWKSLQFCTSSSKDILNKINMHSSFEIEIQTGYLSILSKKKDYSAFLYNLAGKLIVSELSKNGKLQLPVRKGGLPVLLNIQSGGESLMSKLFVP